MCVKSENFKYKFKSTACIKTYTIEPRKQKLFYKLNELKVKIIICILTIKFRIKNHHIF